MDIKMSQDRIEQTSVMETQTQLLFMEKAKKIVAEQEAKLGRKPTFCCTTFGCQMNARDSEKLVGILEEIGYEEKLDENAQGSGLGLSICQLIIEHIGGKIWIDPDYTGGSRFVFTHPIHQTRNNSKKED